MRSLFLWVLLFALLALASGQDATNDDAANSGDVSPPLQQPAPDANAPPPADLADADGAEAAPGSPNVLPADTPSVAPVTIVSAAPGAEPTANASASAVPGAVPSTARLNSTKSSSGSSNTETILAPIDSSKDSDTAEKVKPSPAVGNSTQVSRTTAPKSDVTRITAAALPFVATASAMVFALW